MIIGALAGSAAAGVGAAPGAIGGAVSGCVVGGATSILTEMGYYTPAALLTAADDTKTVIDVLSLLRRRESQWDGA
jgi:hypothetical protein